MDPFITGIDVTESRDYQNTSKKTNNNNNIFPFLLIYDCVFHFLIHVSERRTLTYYCGTLTCLLCVPYTFNMLIEVIDGSIWTPLFHFSITDLCTLYIF